MKPRAARRLVKDFPARFSFVFFCLKSGQRSQTRDKSTIQFKPCRIFQKEGVSMFAILKIKKVRPIKKAGHSRMVWRRFRKIRLFDRHFSFKSAPLNNQPSQLALIL
jgi:hypothetical protein